MAQRPTDAEELMSNVTSAIRRGCPLPVGDELLKTFADNNIARFRLKFPEWSEAANEGLLRTANAHGELCAIVARLRRPWTGEISMDDFVSAGKIIRTLTIDLLSAPGSSGAGSPQPIPQAEWCNWPPVP